MTWGIKVQRVTFALTVVGALALASGANWLDGALNFVYWLLS